MFQLQLSDQNFYCLLRCVLYYRFYGIPCKFVDTSHCTHDATIVKYFPNQWGTKPVHLMDWFGSSMVWEIFHPEMEILPCRFSYHRWKWGWCSFLNHLPNRPVSQIPQCTCVISHNAIFCNRNVHMCAHFCYKMLHCGIFVKCIVGLWDGFIMM